MIGSPKYFLTNQYGKYLVSGFFFDYDEALNIGFNKFVKFRLNVSHLEKEILLFSTFEHDEINNKGEKPVKTKYDNNLIIERFKVERIKHEHTIKNYFPDSGIFLIEFEKPISFYYKNFLEIENFIIESLSNFVIKIKPINLNFYKSCKKTKKLILN